MCVQYFLCQLLSFPLVSKLIVIFLASFIVVAAAVVVVVVVAIVAFAVAADAFVAFCVSGNRPRTKMI